MRITGAAALLSLCAGCATIDDGSHQYVDVLTYPAGADCTVLQGGVPVTRVATPSSVLVRRRFSDLEISCVRPGYDNLNVVVPAHFVGDTFGNLLFFPPGIAIDASTGAWYAYPDALTLTLPRPDPLAPRRAAMAPVTVMPPAAAAGPRRPSAIIATPLPPPPPPAPTPLAPPLVLPPHGAPPPGGPAVPMP